MYLTRSKILRGNYIYPSNLITLKYTHHVLERLEERSMGIECIPTRVRVTKDNIYCGRTRDGTKLHSVVIRLSYTSSKFIFLVLNPFDGALKSLWFRHKKSVG